MTYVQSVRPERRTEIPAVTHIDGTARLQTVSRATNPLFHELVRRFGEATGTPVLLNTSFNENEPIVNTPAEAVECFKRTDMDVLVIGRATLRRSGPASDSDPNRGEPDSDGRR